jgi:hypothetical protein
MATLAMVEAMLKLAILGAADYSSCADSSGPNSCPSKTFIYLALQARHVEITQTEAALG